MNLPGDAAARDDAMRSAAKSTRVPIAEA